MPDAPATAEPEISDTLPNGAEVVAEDSEQISQLLARFGIGPELEQPAPTNGAPNETVTPAGEKGAGENAPAAAQSEIPPAPSLPLPPAPAAFTPEQEKLVAERLEAKAKEFEPLTAERDAALAQVEDLTAKLQGITNPAPVPREIDPLLLEDDFNAIDKQERDAERLLAWCDEHEDTGFTPSKEGEKAWTPVDIRKLRRTVEKQINQTLPAARQLVQTRAANRAKAREVYPALFNPKSEEYKIRQGFYQKAPWVKAVFPQFDLWLGDMIAGEKLRQAKPETRNSKLETGSTTPPKSPTPPVLPSPGGAPLATGGTKPKVRGIDSNEFIARGASRNALVDLIKTSNF